MSKSEPEDFEQELQKLRPANSPEELLSRLAQALPERRTGPAPRAGNRPLIRRWSSLLRWLAPATIAASICLALWFLRPTSAVTSPHRPSATRPVDSALTADKVEIDRQLVVDFDAVARLADGRPVRFRCREWMDQVLLQDSGKGVVVEQRVPRLEVVPIGFETY